MADPLSLVAYSALLPQAISGVGELASGFFEGIGLKEPREIKIAREASKIQTEQEKAQREAYLRDVSGAPEYEEVKETVYPMYGQPMTRKYQRPIIEKIKEPKLNEKGEIMKDEKGDIIYEEKERPKMRKSLIELEEEAKAKGFEQRAKAVGNVFDQYRKQYGDISARALLGAISQSPMTQQSTGIDLPKPQPYPVQLPDYSFRSQARTGPTDLLQPSLFGYLQQQRLEDVAKKGAEKIQKRMVDLSGKTPEEIKAMAEDVKRKQLGEKKFSELTLDEQITIEPKVKEIILNSFLKKDIKTPFTASQNTAEEPEKRLFTLLNPANVPKLNLDNTDKFLKELYTGLKENKERNPYDAKIYTLLKKDVAKKPDILFDLLKNVKGKVEGAEEALKKKYKEFGDDKKALKFKKADLRN